VKKIVGLILAFICVLCGCSCNKDEIIKTSIFSSRVKAYLSKENQYYTYVDPFGTYLSIVGYNEDKVYAAEDKFNELVIKYHSLLDRNYYYKDREGNYINNIKVINDSYGSGNSVSVDPIIIEILKEGIEYTKLSNGKFNIFSGPIVDVWDESFNYLNENKYKVDPSEEEIENAMKCVVKVEELDEVFIIDDINNTVTFNKFDGCENGASITLGALAKSYFLEKIKEESVIKNIGSAIYDAGQSSIALKGDNPMRDNGGWYIAVNDSLNGSHAYRLALEGGRSISTSSGDYKGYIKEDGTRRHHIIDATIGYPGNYLLGVTVVGENAMICDIVTTTLMSMNLEEIKQYLKELENKGIILDVALQVEDNSMLKILVNDSMNLLINEIFEESTKVEVFDYGT